MSDPNERLSGAEPPTPPGPPASPPSAPGPTPAHETTPHARPPVIPPAPVHISGTVGGDVAAGDLHKEQTAGRDIVGRDVVTNTTTTNVGFSAAMVLRLVLAVGVLVTATGACFFALGTASAVAVVVAFSRPVNSNNPAAAQSLGDELAALRSLPPGQHFQLSFTEEEISSYFHLMLEPQFQGQITDGQVRLMDSGQIALSGRAAQLGGLRFAATFAWQKNTPGAPLRLTGAVVHLLPLGNSPLGWVPLPTAALQPLAARLNSLFGNVVIQAVQPVPGQPHAWVVAGVAQ